MTVLNYFITVTSSATPISQDSSVTPSVPDPRLTKIILPKKKQMKWSTGVAPGDYGGPPTTTKLRKYWGGEEEDPLTSDEFIWNKDFMGRMKRLIQDSDSDASAQTAPVKVSICQFSHLCFLLFFFLLPLFSFIWWHFEADEKCFSGWTRICFCILLIYVCVFFSWIR